MHGQDCNLIRIIMGNRVVIVELECTGGREGPLWTTGIVSRMRDNFLEDICVTEKVQTVLII